MSSYWRSIHVLRAAAALLVVAHHAPFYMIGRVDYPPLQFPYGAAGVDIFFVVSGFVMYCTTTSRDWLWFDFLRKRLIRIVPMYWFITLGYATTVWLFPSIFTTVRIRRDEFFSSMIFLPIYNEAGYIRPVVGAGWTLYFELFFYSIVALLLAISSRAAVTRAAIVLSVAVAGAAILGAAKLHTIGQLLSPIALEFVGGVCVASIVSRARIYTRSRALRLASSALLFVAGVVLVWSHDVNDLSLERTVFWGSGAVLVVLAFAIMEPELVEARLVRRGFDALGDASYSLYLIHYFTFSVTWRLMPSSVKAHAFAAAAILFVMAILPAVLVHRRVEKPLTRLAERALQLGVRTPKALNQRDTVNQGES